MCCKRVIVFNELQMVVVQCWLIMMVVVVVCVNLFMFGFFGVFGVLVVFVIGGIVDQFVIVFVYIGVVFFLVFGFDLIVMFIEKKFFCFVVVIIVVVVVIFVFVGIIFVIVLVLVEQISNFIKDGLKMVEDFMESQWFKDVSGQFGMIIQDVVQGVFDFVQNFDNFFDIGGGVFVVGVGIVGGFIGVMIVLIFMFYFMVLLCSMKCIVVCFVLFYQCDMFSELLEDVFGVVGCYVMGQVSLVFINGVFSFIVLLIIGVLVLVLFVFIVFIGLMILFVGMLMVFIINLLICLFVLFVMVFIVFGYYFVYMQIEVYVLLLCIMSCVVVVFGVFVVIVVVVGGVFGGIFGVFVVILVVVSIIIIVQKVIFFVQDCKKVLFVIIVL